MDNSLGNEKQDQNQSKEKNLKRFFLQEKPTDMIVILRRQNKSYASELSTKADTTYSHAVKVMNRMKEIGLVESEKIGRKKEYRLTEKGQKLADNLINMCQEVEGMEVKSRERNKKWGLESVKSAMN